ncbi:MAG: DEAD/DEAH box helicase [Pseudomonadota bacterium]
MIQPVHDTNYNDLPEILQSHPITEWLMQRGWIYHPHQLETLHASQKRRDVLLFAPTGAGKTLAGFLPSLVDLVEQDYPENQLHTLYISFVIVSSVMAYRSFYGYMDVLESHP